MCERETQNTDCKKKTKKHEFNLMVHGVISHFSDSAIDIYLSEYCISTEKQCWNMSSVQSTHSNTKIPFSEKKFCTQ